MANGQKRGTATPVAVKTNVGTKVFVAFAVGLALGLAAYGYGYGFIPGIKPIIPIQPPLQETPLVPPLGVTISQCNVASVSNGGFGRCYPGCTTDVDCSDADVSTQVGAYVSTYSVCKEKAVALCGPSAGCVKSVCGDEKVICRQGPNGGICSRPNFNFTQAQCAATAPGYGSAAPAGTLAGAGTISACSPTGGKCFRSCKENTDCVSPTDQQIYQACIKAALPSCTTSASPLAAPQVDQGCLAKRCPKPVAGTCLKAAVGAPAHCAEPTAATTPQACSQSAGTALAYASGTVWVGNCIVNGNACTSDADCPARKVVPGYWLGMCPSQTGGQANCTPNILTLCKKSEALPTTCVRTPPQEGGPARCSRSCLTDKDCPSPDVQKCQDSVKKKCLDAGGVVNQDCYDKNITLCPAVNACIVSATSGQPGRCSNATGATTEADCAMSGTGGQWVGTCGTTDKQCKNDKDCQPQQPPSTTPTTTAGDACVIDRCYPGCSKDADCGGADMYKLCQAKAVNTCKAKIAVSSVQATAGALENCVIEICGKIVPRCIPETHLCSLPQFGKTAGQCNDAKNQYTDSYGNFVTYPNKAVGTCVVSKKSCSTNADCPSS
jgi:hypothetical protein